MTSDTRAEGWTRPWMDDPDMLEAAAARSREATERAEALGRWPSNLVLVHHPDCRQTTGTREVKSATHYPAARGKGGIGNDGHAGQADLDEVSLNVETLDEWVCAPGCPSAALDDQSGEAPSTYVGRPDRAAAYYGTALGEHEGGGVHAGARNMAGLSYSDTGGASRFFARFAHAVDEQIDRDGPVRYVAKAPGKERPSYVNDDGERIVHSTVKPLALVQYLVKLVTPPGGIVLDPFTGSGTTAEAAILEGMRFVGCELTDEYLPLIGKRIARGYRGGPDYPDPVDPPARPTADDDQPTLFDL